MTRRELREAEKLNALRSPRDRKANATGTPEAQPEFRIEDPAQRTGVTVLSAVVAPLPVSTQQIPAIARRPRGADRKALGKRQHTKIVALSGITSVSVAGAALAAVLASGVGAEQAAASSADQANDAVTVAKKLDPVAISATGGSDEGKKAGAPDDKASSEDKGNFAGGVPDQKPTSKAASRSITRTALAGCDGKRPAGTFTNGELPDSALCEIGVEDFKLRADAALSFAKMNAAYKKDTGKSLELNDAYRDMAGQVAIAGSRPGFAARPGTSPHGWGIGVDMGGGTGSGSGQQYDWLVKNGEKFGWENPDWAKANSYELWHWEYVPGRGNN